MERDNEQHNSRRLRNHAASTTTLAAPILSLNSRTRDNMLSFGQLREKVDSKKNRTDEMWDTQHTHHQYYDPHMKNVYKVHEREYPVNIEEYA